MRRLRCRGSRIRTSGGAPSEPMRPETTRVSLKPSLTVTRMRALRLRLNSAIGSVVLLPATPTVTVPQVLPPSGRVLDRRTVALAVAVPRPPANSDGSIGPEPCARPAAVAGSP